MDEPDWKELSDRYPLADVLGQQENTSTAPVQKLDVFEKAIIIIVIISAIGVLLTQ